MGNILQHFLSGLPETFLMFCSLEMRNILQHFLSGPPEYEDALLSYAWNSLRLKSVDTLIINKVTLRMRMFGYTEENGMKVHKEYTPLVIACMYRDLKLATELIKLGADVNLQVRPKDMQFPSEEGVPALYFATNLGDTEIVKLLLNSGANVNGFQGRRQCVDLQEPEEELYSIFDHIRRTYTRYDKGCHRSHVFVELYLEAGAKLNTTRWGPCLFYGRGKVFKPTRLPLNPGPTFRCDTAILLLQRGVDPNMYNLSDVWFQFSTHTRYSYIGGCVRFSVILETFLAAGYHFTNVDQNNRVIREKLRRFGVNVGELISLKQMCRSAIRERLRKITQDTTIFPAIDTLRIPTQLKNYLKLRDIIDIDSSSVHCRANF